MTLQITKLMKSESKSDVKSLYASLMKELIKLAIEDALTICSQLSLNGQQILTKVVMFYLDSTLIKFQNQLFMQKTGIVTGENNSVTIANIALHYIIKNTPILTERPSIFRRFI